MKVIVKRYSALITLCMTLFNIFIPFQVSAWTKDELVFPLREISKLECRFEDFDKLSSSCKQDLPILSPHDYSKYATKNGGYNDYTRIYTVLWWASYKYWWDVWNGWHQGTDIATAKGTPVYTIADWKVIEAGTAVGWWKYISIEHTSNGKKFVSNYAHLSKIEVSKGDNVDVSDKIGEVWSTGNSTGNHLHFQIDLPSTFHPYYYDWNACPHSYYDITEKGVCFDELNKNTFDPLVFLESNGAVLDEVKTSSSSSSSSNTTSTSTSTTVSESNIFNTTVYYGYGDSNDVKEIQRIYNKLGYYNGRISGDFEDIENTIIDYQLATGVLENKTDDGAGWFGPKTRTQTEKDYSAYVGSGGQSVLTVSTTSTSSSSTSSTSSQKQVEKVSRENLMTREEREAQEMAEFLEIYKVDFKNTISQISESEVKATTLRIENKKGKWFRGNTPWNVTFSYDDDVISVFPQSFYNFTDGEREITIAWKKSGHTKITIKIGEVIVKTLSISVWETGESPSASSAKIYMETQSTLGEKNTGLILMKDQYNNPLVKHEFEWFFTLAANETVEYCIKKWRLQDIKTIYKRDCFDDEYTDSLSYDYSDTIEWVLVFDYKILSPDDTNLQVYQWNKNLWSIQVSMQDPKWLAKSYEYYDEVIDTLSNWITDWVNKWYFLEDRLLSQNDAINWVKNAAEQNNNETTWIEKEDNSPVKNITREGFLQLTHKYLWNNYTATVSRDYRDMQWEGEVLVASLLGETYEWRDNFWENYFRPDKEITRWEAAYLLVTALNTQWKGTLAVK
jgi:hypothetical protein